MRKLILQMQMTIDGFVEASDKQKWQIWDWGPHCTWDLRLQRYFNDVYSEADCVLLSRVMAQQGFIDHWQAMAMAQEGNPAFDFARRVGAIEKVIATRQKLVTSWARTRVVVGELGQAVSALKMEAGESILAFGGVRFASRLLDMGLVDELQLFVNPTAVGSGRTIFGRDMARYRLLGAQGYKCGIVVSRYVPV